MKCFRQLIILSVSIFIILTLSSKACDIELKPNVIIASDSIYLKDITTKCPKKFKGLFIANSPYINNPLTITKAYIQAILKRQHIRLTICGDSSSIKRKLYYITEKTLKKLIKKKDIKILSKMPVILPYNNYKIKIRKIINNREFIWIELSILKKGKFYRNIGISAKRQITALYPVARYGIRRGEVVTLNKIKFMRINQAMSETAFKSLPAIIGKVAITDIRQGQSFTSSNTKRDPLVKRGDLVTVNVIDGPIKISTVAKALRGGFKNDIIPIMYLKSKRVAVAVIVGKKIVEVQ